MAETMTKTAIVLFNLGGPDNQEAVRPFLRNLFRDPAIIQAPGFVREPLAWLISTLRDKSARENYAKMGGGSPIMPETEKQVAALKDVLEAADADTEFRLWPAMRYWHPFVEDVAQEVADWGADEIILLPLYPQFSTTTTGSSLTAWEKAGGSAAKTLGCYPLQEDFIEAHADLIRKAWQDAGRPDDCRLLFSAHGLPKKIVDGGDPYQWQVEQTCAAVAKHLPELGDWQVCYQSRVGPLEWIGPSTEDAIEGAARDGKGIILTPIAFVSEHIETLVELDEEYLELAEEHGVNTYVRVPALGDHPKFIQALARLVEEARGRDEAVTACGGQRLCPAQFGRCPCRAG